jgi:PhzF family phenazine biosynthesis protein
MRTTNQKIFQVDAFTNKPFQGNPAGVCLLTNCESDEWMQQVAQEMNLSETAFLLPENDGFNLRWFTPTTEVPLCGHATLASAHVLWSEGYLSPEQTARFYTKSGLLIAKKQDDWIELDFPVNHSQIVEPPPLLNEVLGVGYKSVSLNSLGYLVELASPQLVRQIQPDFQQMRLLPVKSMIVTSTGDLEYDFISRFFAPGFGIDEDPVTGAAHCCLAPFWRYKLQKDTFLAYQASQRGGILRVTYSGGNRVFLSGQAITLIRGELLVNY